MTATAWSPPSPTALDNTTKYGYDQLGNRVTATAPDNSVTTTAYDADGEPLSVTGPTGAVTDSTYDYLGRGHLNAGGAVRRLRDRRLHHELLLRDDPAGGLAVAGDQPGRGEYAVTPMTRRGRRRRSPTGRGTRPPTPSTRWAVRPQVTYPDGTATATGYDAAGNVTSTANLDASGKHPGQHVGGVRR